MESLGIWMLRTERALVIAKKAIFMRAIIAFASFIPEPREKELNALNSHLILEVEDKFWEHYTFKNRIQLFKAAWKILVAMYEHAPEYRHLFDWLLEELVEMVMDGRWKPRPPDIIGGWKESHPNGLYRGRKFKSKIDANV